MELQELNTLASHDFKGLINQIFDIQFEENKILKGELIEVIEHKNYSPLERTPFTITFRTSQKNEYYPQATFVIHHPTKGKIPMFLSPKGFDSEGMKYEAIFS